MLDKREFPILEFDNNIRAKIEPFNVIQKQDEPHIV